MNQARSPFAQAVLEHNFPDDQISSTGVTAIEGTPILPSVIEIAKNWGVPIAQEKSRTLKSASNDLLVADLVIAAERTHADTVRNFGYKGALRNYEEILEDTDFIPQDPGGLLPDAVSRELGKVGALTLRAAIDAKGYPHTHSITVVIPHGVSDLSLALATAQMSRVSAGAILIDADIRAPIDPETDELGLERVYFDIDHVESGELPEVGPQQILTHARQIDFPEKYFLSPMWRNWIQRLADRSPVVLVTAPRHSQMRRLADSYLAAYMSDEFTVISA
jgi:protein-tyrosine-phosphatase